MTGYWCERAWLPTGITAGVLVTTDASGTIAEVSTVDDRPAEAVRLDGLVLPGFANAHSHAFHRALRGRTHGAAGTFWTWRREMYALADRLNPDSYFRLAEAVFAGMAVAGFCCVGEFHYLHHQAGGTRYAEPNAMGEAVRAAAHSAGIRLTLLDSCYLAGGIGEPLSGPALRFGDGSVSRWAARVAALPEDATTRVGTAIHSVRAVPRDAIGDITAASTVDTADRPLHVHLSEQPAENQACLAAYGKTPTQLLADAGALGRHTTAVHATHLTGQDRDLLAGNRVTACLCPTTEADLGDGIGPAAELAGAGCRLAIGTDQHAMIDPMREVQALEHGERLRSGRRGRLAVSQVFRALTVDGHACLGWPGAGRIAVGAPADLVAIHLDTARTAGALPEQALFAATSADVAHVVVGGEPVASGGVHHRLGYPGGRLARVIGELWR